MMAALRGVPVPEVGTTTFRPPYTPVAIGALAGRSVGHHFRPVRRTPLHDWHVANGATMTETGLWLRPWYYSWAGATVEEACVREMRQVREAAGIVDISTLVVRCRRKIRSGQEPSAVAVPLPEPRRGHQLSASHH
jgi:hypothetical protein